MNKPLFWNVDTQVDFIDENGLLAVPEASSIRPVLAKITNFATKNCIQTISTSDWHNENTVEISNTPDFVNTFPVHCMEHTHGASLIPETLPQTPYTVLDWYRKYSDEMITTACLSQNILIRKDMFDVFAGNPNTHNLLSKLSPSEVYVYGVATNVCVHFAVVGLLKRGVKVFVIEDGIKALPNIPSPVENWIQAGATITNSKEVFATLS